MKSRGKPLDKKYGKYAEGYLLKDGEEYCIVVRCDIDGGEIQDWHYEPIDPSTLEHKIGDKWYSVEELETLPARNELAKKEAMKNFFDTYSNDIEGTLHNMSQDKLLEYLDGDIFIGCASAATGIPERDFVEYSLEYFGFADKAV